MLTAPIYTPTVILSCFVFIECIINQDSKQVKQAPKPDASQGAA